MAILATHWKSPARSTEQLTCFSLNRNWFSSPNTLEGLLARNTTVFLAQPRLLCFEKSVTFCNPVNIVQQEFRSLGGITHAYSSEFLAEQFLAGRRVDVEAYSGFIPNSCHQEVELQFQMKSNG